MIEIWKDIEGFEGLYQVSNFGRVKSLKREIVRKDQVITLKEKILKFSIRKGGYLMTRLYNGTGKQFSFYIHVLVARSFVVNSKNKPEVNHIDNDPSNNHSSNLEWVTHSENIKHSFKYGNSNNKGENHPSVKLTDEEVKQLRRLDKTMSYKKLGELFGVSGSYACMLCKNKSRI